jgi:hypothetical protein
MYPKKHSHQARKLYLQEALSMLMGVLCLLLNDFDDEICKTRGSKNGCHCQGRASQRLTD